MRDGDHAKIVRLKDVAGPASNSFVDGPFGSNLRSTEYSDFGVGLIQLQNIGDGHWVDDNQKYISAAKFDALRRHGALPGDIAIAKMADPVARACLLPRVAHQFLVLADCMKLTLDRERFDPRYVVHAINSHETRREAERKSTGTTRLRINLSALKTVHIWVPPLPEQHLIAEILDTLDEAIRKTEQIIAKLKQVKQGLLHDLLTRGIDENGELRDPERHPEQFKDSPLGRIPREWEILPLEACVRPEASITYGIVQAGPHVPGGVPYIRTGDMSGDRLTLNGLLRTSPRIAGSYHRSRVGTGEIVCAIRATVGKVLEVPPQLNDANFTQGTARISPGPALDARFLLWAMRGPAVQRQFELSTKGTTFQEITLARLRRILIPRPERRDEQTRISAAMDRVERRERTESGELDKLRLLKQALVEDLLTGRVRVTHLLGETAVKRDMDLIRAILFKIEEHPSASAPDQVMVEGYTDEEVSYHAYLTYEAGLVDGIDMTDSDSQGPEVAITRLTWWGHDFLDAAREPSRWEQAKDLINKAGGASLQIWVSVLTELVKKSLDL